MLFIIVLDAQAVVTVSEELPATVAKVYSGNVLELVCVDFRDCDLLLLDKIAGWDVMGVLGVSTFYRQTSDARLKDDVGPLVSLNLSLIPPS